MKFLDLRLQFDSFSFQIFAESIFRILFNTWICNESIFTTFKPFQSLCILGEVNWTMLEEEKSELIIDFSTHKTFFSQMEISWRFELT